MDGFNGLGLGLGNLSRLSKAKTRSISAENPTGEPGKGAMAIEGSGARCARDLGQGWKVNPCMPVKAGETFTMADIEGPGVIQSIWIGGNISRNYILRFYWDDQEVPSVETPLGDFFGCGWGPWAQISSLPVALNPNRGQNCYWEMPFRKRCRITLENRGPDEMVTFYQINYALTEVPEDCAYFHAQFRRVNPLPYKQPYTILDGIKGQGHYVGTIMAWGVNNVGWWGEGEIKFYMDSDTEFPTICGTGVEDYFGGSYNWDVNGSYTTFTTPFLGMYQVIKPDGLYQSQQRFGLYRFHVMDPVRFEDKLKVTIQALGWRSEGRYLAMQDDIASVALWYQTLPTAPFPELPDKDYLEVI